MKGAGEGRKTLRARCLGLQYAAETPLQAECFAVLAEKQQQQREQQGQHGQHEGASAPVAEGGGIGGAQEDGMEWEDVAVPPAGELAAAVGGRLASDDALPGYAADPPSPFAAAPGAAAAAAAAAAAQHSPTVEQRQPQQQDQQDGGTGPLVVTAAADLAVAALDNEAVMETLEGVYKLVVNRALPAVREWLRVLSRVGPGSVPSVALR